MNLLAELRRRNVFRVGIAYVLIAWVLLQAADFGLDLIEAPNWTMRALVLLAALGLPAALIFAWVFEMTPEGLRREKDIDRDASITPSTGRKLDRVIIAVLVLAVVILLADRTWRAPGAKETDAAPAVAGTSATAPTPDTPRSEPRSESETPSSSIAVLPFVNMSADQAQEYFSDGMTEEIINALVRIPGLEVAARTSVFAFKDQQRDVREIGRQLGVGHVLEGSVRSAGNQLRITAQLIKVDDGFHEWSETYDRELDNVFVIQEDIARSIADVLSAQFAAGDSTTLATTDMAAYNDYLRARAILRQRRDNDVENAIELLEAVTRRDPDFAPAWASLAIVGDVLDRHDDAERWANRALALDPDNVDALNALAAVHRDRGQWSEAETLFARALAIDPGSSELIEDYAEFLASVGRVEEQVRVAAEGYAIDPLLVPLAGNYAQGLIAVGDYDTAREVVEGLRLQDAQSWIDVVGLMIPMTLGDDEAVVATIESMPLSEAERQVALDAWRDPTSARFDGLMEQMLPEGAVLDPKRFSDAEFLYQTIMGFRGYVPALRFDRVTLENFGEVYSEMWFTPAYGPLRPSPEFADLVRQAGLPEYWDQRGWPAYCARDEAGAIQCR